MDTILHATFTDAQDGISAVESLLHHGMHAEDINLILPESTSTDATTVHVPNEAVRSTGYPTAGQATTLSATPKDVSEMMAEALVPEPPQLSAAFPPGVLPQHTEIPLQSDAPGYHFDALGAVIRDHVKPQASVAPPPCCHEEGGDIKEGAVLGLVFGLLAAMCVPAHTNAF